MSAAIAKPSTVPVQTAKPATPAVSGSSAPPAAKVAAEASRAAAEAEAARMKASARGSSTFDGKAAPAESAADTSHGFTGKLAVDFTHAGRAHSAEMTAIQGKLYFEGQEVGAVGARHANGTYGVQVFGQQSAGTAKEASAPSVPAQPRLTEVYSLEGGGRYTPVELASRGSKIDTIVAVAPEAEQTKVRDFLQHKADGASIDKAFQQVLDATHTPGAQSLALKLESPAAPHVGRNDNRWASQPFATLTVGASFKVGDDLSVNGKALPCDAELRVGPQAAQVTETAKRDALRQVGVSEAWLNSARPADVQQALDQIEVARETPGHKDLDLSRISHRIDSRRVAGQDSRHTENYIKTEQVEGHVSFEVGPKGAINGQPSKLDTAVAALVEKETKPWPNGEPESYIKTKCAGGADSRWAPLTSVAQGTTRQGKIETILAALPEAARADARKLIETGGPVSPNAYGHSSLSGGVTDESLDRAFKAVLDARNTPGTKALQLELTPSHQIKHDGDRRSSNHRVDEKPVHFAASLEVSADGKVNGALLPVDLQAKLSTELTRVPPEFKDETLKQAGLSEQWLRGASPLQKDYALVKLREAAMTPGEKHLDLSIDYQHQEGGGNHHRTRTVHADAKLTLSVTDDGKVNGKQLACDTALTTTLLMDKMPMGQKRAMMASLGFDGTAQRAVSVEQATTLLTEAAMATRTPGNPSLNVAVGGDRYQLSMKVGEGGVLEGAGAAKIPPPPETSWLDDLVSMVVPVVCTIVQFIAPEFAPIAQMVSGVCGAYTGIKTGNILAVVAGVAGASSAGLTAFGAASNAGLAQTLSTAATWAGRANTAIGAVRSGDVAGLFSTAISAAQVLGAPQSLINTMTDVKQVVGIGTSLAHGNIQGALSQGISLAQTHGASEGTISTLQTIDQYVGIGTALRDGNWSSAASSIGGMIGQSLTLDHSADSAVIELRQLATFGKALAGGDLTALASAAGAIGLSQGTIDNLTTLKQVASVGTDLAKGDFTSAIATATKAGASPDTISELTQAGHLLTVGQALAKGDFETAIAGATALGAPDGVIRALTQAGLVATVGTALEKGDLRGALAGAGALGLSEGAIENLTTLGETAMVGKYLAKGDFTTAIAAARAAGASDETLRELAQVGQVVTVGKSLAKGDLNGAIAGATALGASPGIISALTQAEKVATVGKALAKGDLKGALAGAGALGLSKGTIDNLTTLGETAMVGKYLAKGDFTAAIAAAKAAGASASTLSELAQVGQVVTVGKSLATGDIDGAIAGARALGASDFVITALTQAGQVAALGKALVNGNGTAALAAAGKLGLSQGAIADLTALGQDAKLVKALARGDFASAIAAARAGGASKDTLAELTQLGQVVALGKAVAMGDVAGTVAAAKALGISQPTAGSDLTQFGNVASVGNSIADGDVVGAFTGVANMVGGATQPGATGASDAAAPKSVDELVSVAMASVQAPATAGEPQSYVVTRGDTLSKVALTTLGDANRWPELYDYNRARIGSNPNNLRSGVELAIPPADYKLPSSTRTSLLAAAYLAPAASATAGGPAPGTQRSTPPQTAAIQDANSLIGALKDTNDLSKLISNVSGTGVAYVEGFQTSALQRMIASGGTPSTFVADLERRLSDAQASFRTVNTQRLNGVAGAGDEAARLGSRVSELQGYVTNLKSAKTGLEVLEGMKKAAPLLSGFSATMDALDSKSVTTIAGKNALAFGLFMGDAAFGVAATNPAVLLADGSLKILDPLAKAALKKMGYGDVVSPTEKLALSTQLSGAINNIVGLGEAIFTRNEAAMAELRNDNASGKNGLVIQGFANLGELLAASRLLDFP